MIDPNLPMPHWLQTFLIFAAFALLGSAVSYFIDLSGLIIGVLAVMVFKRMEEKQ